MTNPRNPDPLAPTPTTGSGAGTTPETYSSELGSPSPYESTDYPAGGGVGVVSSGAGFGGADAGSSAGRSTTQATKEEAANVKDTAVDSAKNVAGTAKEQAAGVAETAKEQAAQVADEARQQARALFDTVTSEAREQGRQQQQRIASAVHALSKELGSMASSSSESGPLTDLAHQASRKGGEIAHWLENREPKDVLEEARRFARRRPVMFLALCGLAGVLAGRVTRGAVAANTSLDSPDTPDYTATRAIESPYATGSSYGAPSAFPTTPPVSTYETSTPAYQSGTYETTTGTAGATTGAPASLVEENTTDYPPDSSYNAGTTDPDYRWPNPLTGDDDRTERNR
jgi:uncharacterized phage infection (PIP) family protein YhgE